MLILTRKPGETIRIGDNVTLRVIEVSKGSVKLGIDAPASVTILREEVYERIVEANIAASQGSVSGLFKAADILKKKSDTSK